MKAVLLAVLLLIAAPAQAFDDWEMHDKVLLGTAELTLAVDWLQTLEIAKSPRWTEANVILGKYPSVQKVNIYFASSMLLTYVMAEALPNGWRTGFLGGLTALEVAVIIHNSNAGIKIGGRF